MNDAPNTFTNTKAFLRVDIFMAELCSVHHIQMFQTHTQENPVLQYLSKTSFC